MGFFGKLAFWKKDDGLSADLGSLELPGDSLKPIGGLDNTSGVPGMGSHDTGASGSDIPSDPLGFSSTDSWNSADSMGNRGQQGAMNLGNSGSSSDLSLGSSAGALGAGRDSSMQDSEDFFSANTPSAPPGARYNATQSYSGGTGGNKDLHIMAKDIEVISSKLDAVMSTLDSINQRMRLLEKLYHDHEEREKNKKYW